MVQFVFCSYIYIGKRRSSASSNTSSIIFTTVNYILIDGTVHFEEVNAEEVKNKYLKEDSTQKVPVQSNSVCSNKSESEVASVNLETPVLNFFMKIASFRLNQMRKIST